MHVIIFGLRWQITVIYLHSSTYEINFINDCYTQFVTPQRSPVWRLNVFGYKNVLFKNIYNL